MREARAHTEGTLLNKRAHPGCGPAGIVSESVNRRPTADASGQRVIRITGG